MRDGPNCLTPFRQTPEFVRFARNLFGGFSFLLWIGAMLCFIAFGIQKQTYDDAPYDNFWLGVALTVVVFITGCFSYYQNNKQTQIFSMFENLMPQRACVIRNGKKYYTDADDLVVGDLIEVKLGNCVPADIRIIKSRDCKIDNSSLTGESMLKFVSPNTTSDNPLDSENIAFLSSNVVEGSLMGIVIRTGDDTLMGKIAALTSTISTRETPIAAEIRYFTRFITIVAVMIGIFCFLISMSLGHYWLDSVVFLIGVIVAKVPEGLLVTVTVCLTLTAKRMRKKNCLVKHPEAVEALGSTTVICTDKTGTLTQNRMTVVHIWVHNRTLRTFINEVIRYLRDEKNESGIYELLRCAMLCNSAEFVADPKNAEKPILHRECDGNALEAAILKHCELIYGGVMRFRHLNRMVYEVPFNSEAKYQLSIHKVDLPGCFYLVVVKGAPEIVTEFCSTIYIEGRNIKLTQYWLDRIDDACIELGKSGERVIGFCELLLNDVDYPEGYRFQDDALNFELKGFRFLGLMSMIDPPRPSVPDSVKKCREAGIKV
jgi:sodium/potassium-transporting ATPase subunit alpha